MYSCTILELLDLPNVCEYPGRISCGISSLTILRRIFPSSMLIACSIVKNALLRAMNIFYGGILRKHYTENYSMKAFRSKQNDVLGISSADKCC